MEVFRIQGMLLSSHLGRGGEGVGIMLLQVWCFEILIIPKRYQVRHI